jgi:sulfide:quinone oxidoreductase
VPADKFTQQAKAYPNIFALGDANDIPASKAGSVAHFEVDVFVENFLQYAQGLEMTHRFDGHANCFIETGGGKAMLIDFNYDTEPLPGRFPLAGIGPLSLLQESRLNHLGKLGFKWIYWNMLMPGRPIPISTRMSTAGKRMDVTTAR